MHAFTEIEEQLPHILIALLHTRLNGRKRLVAKRIIFIFDGFREELNLQIEVRERLRNRIMQTLGQELTLLNDRKLSFTLNQALIVNSHAQVRRETLEKLNHLRGKFRRIPEKQHVDADRLRNTSDLKAIGR